MVNAPAIRYKDNLLVRLGGSANLDFVIESYCEHIKDDPSLDRIFGKVRRKKLAILQRELIMAAIIEPQSASEAKALHESVVLNHSPLFEIGMNEKHFDILFHHFSDALRAWWTLSKHVIMLCEKYFKELRPIFKEQAKLRKRKAAKQSQKQQQQEKVVPSSGGEDLPSTDSVNNIERLLGKTKLTSNKQSISSVLQRNKRKD
eukprot:scaffold1366_cov91-Cylindrotheca_fusiformis.AAC.2